MRESLPVTRKNSLLDGVYGRASDGLRFYPHPSFTTERMFDVLYAIHDRLSAVFRRRGYVRDDGAKSKSLPFPPLPGHDVRHHPPANPLLPSKVHPPTPKLTLHAAYSCLNIQPPSPADLSSTLNPSCPVMPRPSPRQQS